MTLNLTKEELTRFKRLAFLLGLAGIIPFLICAAGIALKLHSSPFLLKVVTAYAAIILSFLAGIHWASAIHYHVNQPKISFWLLIESTLPALLAWLLLLLDSTLWQFNGFIILYALIWVVDVGLVYYQIYPKWFFGLRSLISLIVILLLFFVRFHLSY